MIPQDQRYTRVAIALHWMIAGLIFFNLALGFVMEGFEERLRRFTVDAHISSGISVLLLTVVRIIWRLVHKPPPFLSRTTTVEKVAAHCVHFSLYAMMVFMPLSGWAIISSHPPPAIAQALAVAKAQAAAAAARSASADSARSAEPTAKRRPRRQLKLWGIVPWFRIGFIQQVGTTPAGIERQKVMHDDFAHRHMQGSLLLIALLLLHIAGALKHQFIDRQPELARMGLGRSGEKP